MRPAEMPARPAPRACGRAKRPLALLLPLLLIGTGKASVWMRGPRPTSLGCSGRLVRLGRSSSHSCGRWGPLRPCAWRSDAPTMCMPVEDAKKAVADSAVASRSAKQDSDAPSAVSDGSQDPAALTETPQPPLTLQGAWQSAGLPVLVLCCFIGAVCALDRVVMSVAILPMSEQFGYSDSVKGLIASAFSLGYCIGLVPAGVASSSSSPKMVLGIGLVVWSLAQALTPAAAENSVLSLLLARIGMGIGEAAAIPSIQVIAANFVPQRFRSQFWGLLTASLSMGTIGAYTLTPPLVDSAGWQSAFFIYGGAGIAIAALWFALGADEPKASAASKFFSVAGENGLWMSLEEEGSRDACFPEACEVEEEAEATRRAETATAIEDSGVRRIDANGAMERAMERVREVPWSDMAASRPVWALAAAHSASNFFLYFALSWLPTYFAYQFNLSTAGAASASQLPFVAAAVASVSAGAICDRVLIGWAGLPLTRARKVMQGVACVGPGAAMVCLALLASGAAGVELNQNTAQAIFVGALACQSFSAAGFGCAAQDISRRYSSLLYGATSAVSVVVGAFGQYFTGVVLDLTDKDFSAMFYLTGAVELCGVLMFTAWWNSERTFE